MSDYDTNPVVAPSATDSAAARSTSSPVLSIISFVLSAVAIFIVPILFGGAAIVLAAVAMARKQRYGRVALAVAIAATILGIVLGAIVGVQATQA
jgi:hypothetical protein